MRGAGKGTVINGSLALALDLGTTTLAGRLLDASSGRVLAEGKVANPQRSHGADVIRRLEVALAGGQKELSRLLVAGIVELVDGLLHSAGVERAAIVRAAGAANPAITALLCQDDVRSLLFPPHRPDHRSLRFLALAELDLDVPLLLFPLVSGYVGGDMVACLYGLATATTADQGREKTLCIDLGTNGEIALGDADGWIVTSVAAGPAFEGGEMACGLIAGPGAISGVTLDNDRLRLEVIGGGPPCGLAGSGLFATIAAGVTGGLIERSGRIVTAEEVDSNLARYLLPALHGSDLCLYRDVNKEILVTQADVRAFQLAKGAIRAGIDCLLQQAGLSPEGVDRVIVTGAFGLSLDNATLKSVAMLPPVMIEKTLFVPGGALTGVSRFLLTTGEPEVLGALAARIRSYPLSGTPAFERAFLAALDF